MKRYTCICGHFAEGPAGSSIAAIADATGFKFIFNIRNGLETMWLCQTCWAKCEPALAVLAEVFGDEVSNIHFNSLFKKLP